MHFAYQRVTCHNLDENKAPFFVGKGNIGREIVIFYKPFIVQECAVNGLFVWKSNI